MANLPTQYKALLLANYTFEGELLNEYLEQLGDHEDTASQREWFVKDRFMGTELPKGIDPTAGYSVVPIEDTDPDAPIEYSISDAGDKVAELTKRLEQALTEIEQARTEASRAGEGLDRLRARTNELCKKLTALAIDGTIEISTAQELANIMQYELEFQYYAKVEVELWFNATAPVDTDDLLVNVRDNLKWGDLAPRDVEVEVIELELDN